MADEENTQQENIPKARVLPITHVSTCDDFTARVGVQEKVTAVFFFSSDCPITVKEGLPAFETCSTEAEFEPTISFVQVDVNAADSDLLQRADLHALPAFHFYFDNILIEGFSGSNVEKWKLMAKNAVVRRTEIIAAREEEARAAAAATPAATE
mmetsp:Transcript_74947/g.87023  ORF Transcript_74947/g.87023 Transcript_74947/m.87023 type:complete len:154 (+) Transcript_74947:66-527(+)